MVVIGGDGTMSGAADLIDRGLNIVGVPKTIDNDLWATDITFGHDTAVTTAADALDKVHTTASSHHRVMVVELMGRYAGWLALHAGLASGADVILIPEIPFRLERVAEKCLQRRKIGKRFTIIAVGEGAAPAGGKQFVDRMDPTSPDPIRLGGVGKFVAEQVEKRHGPGEPVHRPGPHPARRHAHAARPHPGHAVRPPRLRAADGRAVRPAWSCSATAGSTRCPSRRWPARSAPCPWTTR